MRSTLFQCTLAIFGSLVSLCSSAPSTVGIEALVERRMPKLSHKFTFSLDVPEVAANSSEDKVYDDYTVSNGPKGTIEISGNTQIALATGLRWYMANIMKVDLFWFIGSRLDMASSRLPRLKEPHHGASTVPWRYHFNTVTFSYTSAFWHWEEWEQQLDWMALHGINLPLAWIGYEKILLDTLTEAGFKEEDVFNFYSGPAFQSWNRFGNIQSSWGGTLPRSWVDDQFVLGKQVVARMVELGMTPVLPAFTGYVPKEIADVYPNASFVEASPWSPAWPDKYTRDTFLNPADPLYAELQESFMMKQKAAFGNVTRIYTLDQYNEVEPPSGELDYLANISNDTIQSLKRADPDAVWMMQGWIFFFQSEFWTKERISAYLGGVDNSDMIILDLFSESQPQWQRTESYFGKPWIWCMLHGFGGIMGLYGQVESTIAGSVEALAQSPSMMGIGATMEGQEGNEIMYDILFDQAWSKDAISTEDYFESWVASRYSSRSVKVLPQSLYEAWDGLRSTVYNNANLSISSAVPASVLTKYPLLDGLVDDGGTFSRSIPYDPATLLVNWAKFYQAAVEKPALWADSAFAFDLTDVTRQVLANTFEQLYRDFVKAIKNADKETAKKKGDSMLAALEDLDGILAANGNAHYSLAAWIDSARSWASGDEDQSAVADFYEYNARNQVTLWGPNGEINGYASKEWAGIIKTYYMKRWRIFIDGHLSGSSDDEIQKEIKDFELDWQTPGKYPPNEGAAKAEVGQLQPVLEKVVKNWPSLFNV